MQSKRNSIEMSPDSFIQLKGILVITAYNGPIGFGIPKILLNEENIVVTLARQEMSRLVAGNDTANRIVTKMKWGSGGHNPGNPTQPIPPTAADVNLAAPILSPAYKTVVPSYPTSTSVKFTATLEQSEANGEGISEEGLFTEGNVLFARKTFGLITKTADWSLAFSHTILF